MSNPGILQSDKLWVDGECWFEDKVSVKIDSIEGSGLCVIYSVCVYSSTTVILSLDLLCSLLPPNSRSAIREVSVCLITPHISIV